MSSVFYVTPQYWLSIHFQTLVQSYQCGDRDTEFKRNTRTIDRRQYVVRNPDSTPPPTVVCSSQETRLFTVHDIFEATPTPVQAHHGTHDASFMMLIKNEPCEGREWRAFRCFNRFSKQPFIYLQNKIYISLSHTKYNHTSNIILC